MKQVKSITVKLPLEEGKAVDVLVQEEQLFLNAADFVRTAVRRLLREYRKKLAKHGIELEEITTEKTGKKLGR